MNLKYCRISASKQKKKQPITKAILLSEVYYT